MPKKTVHHSDDFVRALVEEVPKFDEMILRDMRPTDSWIGHVKTAGQELNMWHRTLRWIASKLTILARWIDSKVPEWREFSPMGSPAEMTQDRFRAVWPNTTTVRKRVKSKPKQPRKKK